MIKKSFLHTKAMYPDMQVTLKATEQKIGWIRKRNINLLKGLNLYNILILARLEAYMPVCFFSTMVGLGIADNSHRLMSLLIIGLANTFAMAATCAFNDAEDAPEDMLARSTRNIIALGDASKSTGYVIAATAAIISLSLSIIAGINVFLIILTFIAIAFLYSWRPVRMKAMPFLDLSTHAIMGGLMFLSSAWSSGILWEGHVFSVCLIFSSGITLALLAHQLYDYENDIVNKITTTVVVLGRRKTYWIKGLIYFLIVCLLAKENLSGFFSFKLILSFCVVAGSMILIAIILYPKQAFYVSKRMIPWAVNAGAGTAILMWYIRN
ncbi:4-hydroxybenzoate octaprenyltransferase [Candidatus Scalindua japonica]|uniref:4-hydroxybenzoate octaprenyltransferase n=1 Tax=Candidatus Scalindua japonica TaxID=1284222 RepID=A0A286U1U9_9BACT|nr:UbiA family prenyltransferase [Candidatus Scalindua japonica]GAX62123.1 4-hydroxybenzoate octaprenyltransferase [Candidatus Scalindua japonica]